jgi:hypothetical protein
MNKCPYCGNTHETKCPLIKATEYFENGQVKRVEFYSVAETILGNPHVVPWIKRPNYSSSAFQNAPSALAYSH